MAVTKLHIYTGHPVHPFRFRLAHSPVMAIRFHHGTHQQTVVALAILIHTLSRRQRRFMLNGPLHIPLNTMVIMLQVQRQ